MYRHVKSGRPYPRLRATPPISRRCCSPAGAANAERIDSSSCGAAVAQDHAGAASSADTAAQSVGLGAAVGADAHLVERSRATIALHAAEDERIMIVQRFGVA